MSEQIQRQKPRYRRPSDPTEEGYPVLDHETLDKAVVETLGHIAVVLEEG